MLKRTKPGFTEIFSLLLLFLNINFIFLKNLIGIAIAMLASQMRRPKNHTGVANASATRLLDIMVPIHSALPRKINIIYK